MSEHLRGGYALDPNTESFMDVTQQAGAVLRGDISLATSLELLRGSLERGHAGAPPSQEHLRRELERHPDRFRVLRPARGPWDLREGSPTSPPDPPPAVIVPAPAQADTNLPRRTWRLRRSLYWVGATIDEQSPREIARWVRLAHSCASAESHLWGSTHPARRDQATQPSSSTRLS